MTQFIVVSAGRFIVIFFQLLYIKIYTNLLSVNELGDYVFWFTISYFFNALIFVPFDYYQQNKLFDLKVNKKSINGLIKINLKILCLIFLSEIILSIFVYYLADIKITIALLISLNYGVVIYVTVAIRNYINNINYKEVASILLIIDSVLKVIILILLSYYMEINSLTLIFSAFISVIISAVIYFIVLIKLNLFFEGELELIPFSEIIKDCYPISISALLNWAQLQGYRLILIPMGFGEIIGVFSTVSGIGSSAMSAIGNIYSQLKMPSIYNSRGKYLSQYLMGLLLIIFFVIIIFYTLSDFIIYYLTNENFVKYSKIIIFGILIEGINIGIGALAVVGTIKKNTHSILISSIIGLIVCLTLFAIFYSNLSYLNLGIPLVISQIIVLLYLLKKYTN